jgi:hypothetical protein
MQPCRGIAMQRDAAGRVSSQAKTCLQTSAENGYCLQYLYIKSLASLIFNCLFFLKQILFFEIFFFHFILQRLHFPSTKPIN